MRSAGGRAGLAGVVLALAGVGTFGVAAPPERCPSVDVPQLRAAAGEAVHWFSRNQQADGTWLYDYDADEKTAAPEYNTVRHAGAVSGLYQAASAGIDDARQTADRGLAWAADRIIRNDGWAALRGEGEVSAGASALLTSALVERRKLTGDTRYDQLLQELGRFLVAQTEPSGAVLAYYDESTGRPIPGEYSKYYTGESYWALARLHRLFPAGPWGATADRIGRYLATQRDRREDHWPPIPDHWAAYGLAETTQWRPLTGGEVTYARAQAGSFGAQVRWISQRMGPWGPLVRGPMEPRGGGYGVNGEALTHLWRVARADERLADLREPLTERVRCLAGLTIRAQSTSNDSKQRGAWFRDGETRMDDQQHALSGLLGSIAVVKADDRGGGEPVRQDTDHRQAPAWWLWTIVLVAAFNPFRVARVVPRRDDAAVIAGLGGLLGAGAVFLLASTSGPLLDALDVSGPALRVAAGAVGIAAGVLALWRRPPAFEPALRGRRAALVPVAVPLVVTPALVLLALSADADRGWSDVAVALAVAVGVLAGSKAVVTADSIGWRVMKWAGLLLSGLLLAGSVLLTIDGVLAV